MHRDPGFFLGGVVRTTVVRRGADERLPRDPESGKPRHILPVVYREMFLQVCADYHSLPDPMSMRLSDIRFFYDGLRATLKKHTDPSNKPSTRKPRIPKRR